MKKVLVYGAYDLDNLGDDYMMYQVNNKLKSNNIQPVYKKFNQRKNYFNLEIEETLEFPNQKNKLALFFQTLKWVFTKKDINDIDALICMGGGYTNEKFGLQNMLKLYCLIFKFKLNHKKIYFTGQTVGPVNSKIYKFFIKKIYNSADKVFVREIFSRDYLNSFNIKNELVGDDAFLTYQNLNFNLNDIEKENRIIFNYKDFSNYEMYKQRYFDLLLSIAKKSKCKVSIVPFRSAEDSVEYSVNKELYELMASNDIEVDFLVEKDIEKFQKLFYTAKYVIGTAYHSVVLGLIFDNKVYSSYLGEYYKMKINGILDWYDYSKTNCIDMKNLDENNLLETICDTNNNLNNQQTISKLIADKVNSAWNQIILDIGE